MFEKGNRGSWFVVGGLGCLVACLVLFLVGGGAYYFLSPQTRVTSATLTPKLPLTPPITLMPTVRPTKVVLPMPQDQAACEAQGGKWGKIGLAPKAQCNLPTQDAGRVCSDSSECEGACVADLSPAERTRLTSGKEALVMQGKCTSWRITVGCIGLVKNGVVNEITCID